MRGKATKYIFPFSDSHSNSNFWFIVISYMVRCSLPLVSEVMADNMEEILSMGTSALIAYIDGEDQKSRSVFTSFADAHQNRLIYGITSDLTLAKSNVQKAPFTIVYSPLDQVNPFQRLFLA